MLALSPKGQLWVATGATGIYTFDVEYKSIH